MKDKSLGKILLLNLILNTKGLSTLAETNFDEKGQDTIFASLFPKDLYSRLISTTDFDNLPEDEKSKFLFLKSESEGKVDKQELHDYEMQLFGVEAHNRSAASLGVPKTNVVYCNFTQNKQMPPDEWVMFDAVNSNIYINLDKDYSIGRPSLLLENIHAVTRQHSITQNILKAIKDPNSLSDREYFLALSTAVKTYVYQDLRENDPQAYMIELGADYSTPSNIEQVVYAFQKTRDDFQSAGLYGSNLQKDLRRNEEVYHSYLQEELVTNSLVNMEDIFAYFKQSPLNQDSGGLLGKILEKMVEGTAYSFYNSLGADMEEGQSISDYIDTLEEEMFEEYGIEPPTNEELDDFVASGGYAEQEEAEALRQYQKEIGDLPKSQEELAEEFFAEEEDDEMPDYRKMESVLPSEGKIDQIKILPFSNSQSQGSVQE